VSDDAISRPARQCACGYSLQEWRFEAKGRATGVWCAGLGDLANYRLNRATRHDVLDWRGRRVQRGTCEQHPAAGPSK
jgi:hypothetical protein